MRHDVHCLSDASLSELRESHRRYGSGPEFWSVYQRILEDVAGRSHDPCAAANSLARAAESMGAVSRAQLV
ncbi:hypothetical protein [Xanthomonas massiliensis]|uniref:hypothetical protein n=1 Tax=Xanthomonas massiliensis TaxID=1720302 RepID=UPI000824F91F|nr:hypothetical protein [Xanthomonas massiliensis]